MSSVEVANHSPIAPNPVVATAAASGPWPLPTGAELRLLAWPRYDSPDDLTKLAGILTPTIVPDDSVCLCLRYDPGRDGPMEKVVAMCDTYLAPMAAIHKNLELVLVDEPMGPYDVPRLGRSVSFAIQLTDAELSNSSGRRAFLDALGVAVADNTAHLAILFTSPEMRNAATGAQRKLPMTVQAPSIREGRAVLIKRWLEQGYRDAVPYFPPVRFDISLTEACNIRCGYCWQKKKTLGDLTFEAITGIVDTIAAVWPPSMSFTGGEATIWPRFLDLVAHCHSAGVRQMKLVTNGVKLADKGYAETLFRSGISSINLSVDTFDPEKFERLRTFPFATFKKALENCIALRERYPEVHLTLASVLHREVTPEECHEVRQFAHSNGIAYFMQKFFTTSYEEINRRFELEPEQLRAFQDRLEWLEGSVSTAVRRQANPLTEDRILDCYKGVSTVKLHHNGDISFCWTSRPVGNILRKPFIDIWTGEEARNMREYIRDRKCVNCNFDCDIFESLELPQSAASLHAQI